MCEETNISCSSCSQLNEQASPFYTDSKRKPAQFVQVMGFNCSAGLQKLDQQQKLVEEVQFGSESEDSSYILQSLKGKERRSCDLKTLLAEYQDFRINTQWDPIKSRSSDLYSALNGDQNVQDNNCSATTSYFGSSQCSSGRIQPINAQQPQDGTNLNVPNVIACGYTDQPKVNGGCRDEQGSPGRTCFAKQAFQIQKEGENIVERFTDEASSCSSSDADSEEQQNQLQSQRSQAIPIPLINRLDSGIQSGDQESRCLLTTMLEKFVKAPEGLSSVEHKVYDSYTENEKLKVAEADLGMALMKMSQLYDQLGKVMKQNEQLVQNLQYGSSEINTVTQVQADAYETQIMELQAQLSYYREGYEELEELAASQEDQICQLSEQITQLTGSQQALQQNLARKEDINLQMHNQNDELSFRLETLQKEAHFQQQQLVAQLEAEYRNSDLQYQKYEADMEYLQSKHVLLQEENEKLREQIAALQKKQEQSILVGPLVITVVNVCVNGAFGLAAGVKGLAKKSLCYALSYM